MKLEVVAAVAEVKDGEFHPVTVGGKKFSLFQHDGAYYAIEDQCPHEDCLFSEYGVLADSVIECTCHGSQFDAVSGAIVIGPAWHDARIATLVTIDDDLAIDVDSLS